MSAAVRKAIACLALLVFVGSLGLASVPSRHLLVGLDADCASPLFAGQRQTQLDSSSNSQMASREHCVLCHWLRAVGNAKPTLVAAALPVFLAAARPTMADRRAPREQVRPNAPSRAPPPLDSLMAV